MYELLGMSLGDLSPILFLQQRGFGQFSIYAL